MLRRLGPFTHLVLCAAFALLAFGCGIEDPGDSPRGCVGGKCDSPFGEPPDWEAIKARCTPPAADEPVIYQSDFRWHYTLEEMGQRFDEMVVSPKRLHERAYYDEATDSFVLPHTKQWGGDVVMSRRIVESVKYHIEKSLALGYIDHVFFPDLGHSHFFVPEERWAQAYEGTPVAQISRLYEGLLDDPELKVLYHTAEQLLMLGPDDEPLPDREVQWRLYTRNLLGENRGADSRLELLHDLGSKANTVRDYAGHHSHSAGFNVSANQAGCFPYQVDGQTYYFDLSLSDLPYDPNAGGTGDY